MTAARRALPPEPFADDAAGFDYFAIDLHYQHLAAAVSRHLATRRFVLVSGAPPADGELLARCLNVEPAFRASSVPCRPGESFDAAMGSFARALRLPEEGAEDPLWPVLSQLMEDARKSLTRIIVLENADNFDDRSFEELYRFSRLDEPHLVPAVLLTAPSFDARLDALALGFLKSAIGVHLRLQWLEPDEVAAFIRYQLNLGDGGCDDAFTPGAIEAIAFAAKGDPVVVNRLARQTTALVQSARAFAHGVPLPSASAAAEPAAPAKTETSESPQEAAPPQSSAPVPEMSFNWGAAVLSRRAPRLPRGFAAAAYLVAIGTCAAALFYTFGPSLWRGRAETLEGATVVPAEPLTPSLPPPSLAATATAARANADVARPAAAVEPPEPPPAQAAPDAAHSVTFVVPERPAALRPAPSGDSAASDAAAARPRDAVVLADPAPAVAPKPSPERTPAQETAVLVRRGETLLASGDIVSARRFFERAAEAGDAQAGCGMGKSYDPFFLQQGGARGVAGDPKEAARWYRQAARAGSTEAAARLARLATKYPQ
jgi:Sel1 repeat